MRLNDRARSEISSDPLTGIFNRFKLDRELAVQVARARRYRVPLSLVIYDVDRFKSLNDQYGHLAGDEVLRTVARTVESCVGRMRSSDRPLVARYGGEELAVLLPGVSIHGAKRIAEQIIEAVRTTEVQYDETTIRLTISAGLVARRSDEVLSAACKRADEALYEAKDSGRDCVIGLD